MRVFLKILPVIAAVLSLGGCFTGIETTPKITRKHVERSGVATTPEQELAAQLAPLPLNQWLPGHRLSVADTKLSMLLTGAPELNIGDTLVYESIRPTVTFTGDTTLVLTFAHGSQSVDYRTELSPATLAAANRFEMPFTIDLELVDLCRRKLVGQKLYILTSQRIDSMGLNTAGQKFIPVTITNVTAGSLNYPLTVEFIVDDSSLGTNPQATPMTAGSSSGATRNFDRVFSLTDPRLRYPAIREEFWPLIRQSRVVEGMT
ncbi:MAG: hypothetical protein K2G64_01795, partial [Muribaculaceae bacterium]|nr:hypothetical protein [Muribaculaceae bacterium]